MSELMFQEATLNTVIQRDIQYAKREVGQSIKITPKYHILKNLQLLQCIISPKIHMAVQHVYFRTDYACYKNAFCKLHLFVQMKSHSTVSSN